MNFKLIKPSQLLADYVRFFWFLEYDASGKNSFVHQAFAHHCPEFIFCYKGQFTNKSALGTEKKLINGVHGQTAFFSKASSNTDFGIFGFYLYPHALPQLFSVPANELTNQSLDTKTLCGKEGEALEENIMLALDNDQRVKLVSDFLAARLKNARTEYFGICSSIKTISTAYQNISVQSLAESNFLSMRQFERRFKEFSGFSPKLFLRIARFNSVLNKDFRNKYVAQIAQESGYFDESHFIHDFQQFSNNNPKAYFKPETLSATDRGTVDFQQ